MNGWMVGKGKCYDHVSRGQMVEKCVPTIDKVYLDGTCGSNTVAGT